MPSFLDTLISMRKLVANMEDDLGLKELSEAQKQIVLAAMELAERSNEISSSDLQKHSLLAGMPRPTYFKSIKVLEKLGYLKRPSGTERGAFILVKHPS